MQKKVPFICRANEFANTVSIVMHQCDIDSRAASLHIYFQDTLKKYV
jgi:hypothetical protein